METEPPPQEVKASPRLQDDVGALYAIFHCSEDPPRGESSVQENCHGCVWFRGRIRDRFGCNLHLWSRVLLSESESGDPQSTRESLNWKEFTNVVESLEEEGKDGNLANA
jgi:hypothetical protein